MLTVLDLCDNEKPIANEYRVRKQLKGHLAKIYALHWSEDNTTLVSASQDGKMLVWDAMSMNKLQIIPLKSTWVMTCAYSPIDKQMVACGGLDNICSVYNLQSNDGTAHPCRELSGHSGYISCCRFVTSTSIITASGDMTCILWDIEKGSKVSEFKGHNGDVMSYRFFPFSIILFLFYSYFSYSFYSCCFVVFYFII